MYKKPTLAGIFPKPVDSRSKDKFIKENIKRVRKLQNEKAAANKTTSREPLKAVNSKQFKHVSSVIGNYIKNGDSPDGRSASKCSTIRSQSTDRIAQASRNRFRRSGSQQPEDRSTLGSERSLTPSEPLTPSKSPIEGTDLNGNEEKGGADDWRAESGIHMYSDTTISTENSSHGSSEAIDRITTSIASDLRLSPICSSPIQTATVGAQQEEKEERIPSPKIPPAEYVRVEELVIEKKVLLHNICPPGHRVLEDREKKAKLREFEKKRDHVFNEINRLPVTSDTLRVRQMRADLERKLDEVERSIEEYSRAKVFVPIE